MKRVLLIDDDMRHMRYFAEYLELEGFQVDLVESDKEALEYIHDNADLVGLVILDMIMPSRGLFTTEETKYYSRTGVKLFSKISALLPEVPVIVLTIAEDRELVEDMLQMGAKAYLIKERTAPSVLCENVKAYFKETS